MRISREILMYMNVIILWWHKYYVHFYSDLHGMFFAVKLTLLARGTWSKSTTNTGNNMLWMNFLIHGHNIYKLNLQKSWKVHMRRKTHSQTKRGKYSEDSMYLEMTWLIQWLYIGNGFWDVSDESYKFIRNIY
jgi:hypothetical protein